MERVKNHLIVCTHGYLGEELIRTASMITGEVRGVTSFSLLPDMAPEDLRGQIKETLDKDRGDRFLCLVDLLGGTPFNVLGEFRKEYDVTILTGLNLPMFLEAYGEIADTDMEELAETVEAALKNSCKCVKGTGGVK